MKECLRYAEEASKEVGQAYTITTFDLGVCMKALPLIWNNPVKYSKHIVLIGTFHLICAYLKMVGKKMDGSGLSDIMIEAGLMTSGSLSGVLSGKNYDRAMHCHKIVVESLERLLLEKYLTAKGRNTVFEGIDTGSRRKLDSLLNTQTNETLNELLND